MAAADLVRVGRPDAAAVVPKAIACGLLADDIELAIQRQYQRRVLPHPLILA